MAKTAKKAAKKPEPKKAVAKKPAAKGKSVPAKKPPAKKPPAASGSSSGPVNKERFTLYGMLGSGPTYGGSHADVVQAPVLLFPREPA
jgi:hypothetical protein